MKVYKSLVSSFLVSTVMSSAVFASDNVPQISMTVTVPASSELGQLIDAQEKQVYAMTTSALEVAIAQNYQPAPGEPTIIDLINTYYIRGDLKEYLAAIKNLSDRGNPVAWGMHGYYIATANMASKNEEYEEGMRLLALASKVGALTAPNNIGMTLWYDNKLDQAEKYFKSGLIEPHDAVNYGLLLQTIGRPDSEYLKFLVKGAEGGDAAGASSLAKYYGQRGPSYAGEALKWWLISYKAPSAMDPFNGFEDMIRFMSETTFKPGQVQTAQEAANNWLTLHPQAFMDGFDFIRYGARMVGASYDPTQPCVKCEGVLDCFWNYFALGDKTTFAASLIPFLNNGDANALYMQALLEKGFVGQPDPARRRYLLERAVEKYHPLAFLDLALDLWMDGALEPQEHKKNKLFTYAFELLQEGYDRWYNSEHRDVIGDIVFFLAYFNEKGIGTDKNIDKSGELFSEAFKLTPLAAGYLARSNPFPVVSGAYLLLARPSYSAGDWFGGIHHWQKKYQSLDSDQRLKAQALAARILKGSPILERNIYQRMAVGLKKEFSGLE